MRRYFLLLLLLVPAKAFSETEAIVLEPIIIEKEYAHEGTFFTKKLLLALPADSPAAIADYSSSVDLKKRAPFGIQQDLSIRGSIFEDNTVTLNGIAINDPQTGHFSLDIPLTAADIDSLRVEKNALALHYTTAIPAKNSLQLTNAFGEASYLNNLFSGAFGTPAWRNRVSLEQERSAGLRPHTDFKKYTATFSSAYSSDGFEIELLEAYLKKDFGADGFYAAPVYMKEEEHIEKNFVQLRARIGRDLSFETAPYLLLNRDRYILDRDNPPFYTNVHTTLVNGVKNSLRFPNGLFLESEIKTEKIDSTNLSKHSRDLTSLRLGTEEVSLKNFSFKGLAGITYYSGKWPGSEEFSLELKYRAPAGIEPFFLYDRLYRLPSFTELYYSSPSNIGNASLDIQRSDNFELGARRRTELSFISGAIFLRLQKDTIDWVRSSSTAAWQARNIGNLQARGIDLAYSFRLPDSGQEFSLNYTFLYLDKDNPFRFSKYVFNYLKHKAVFLYHFSRPKYTITPALVYEKPQSRALSGRFLANIRIEFIPHRNFRWFAQVDNLFNAGYEEFDFIKAAGRFWKTGVTAQF